MPMKDMFAELNQSPNISSQQSFVNKGQPRMGADAMYQQMGQMPRGTGFAEQGGYDGGIYNTPRPQPMQQPMQQPMRQPMQQPMPQQARPTELTPEQIGAFRQQMHQERLKQMFNQERMQGMLGER